LWHNAVIFLQLSVKYRRDTIHRCLSQAFACFVVLHVYSPAQTLKLQTYSTHSTITRANNYKINISCSKISSIILHYKKKALQHI
jgi:hypothetical protein